ncbi:hypothetical protein [Streptomyces sp. NPDC058674]|uniref:hypothetical protein n=1 Tax=Streptomyces sp. NPDC058674 TaxID=3346592 RepID=UPI0036483190
MALQHLSAPARASSRDRAGTARSGVVHVKVRHADHYTVVGNHLAQHRALSLVAMGLALHIQSLPTGARVGIKRLTDRFPEGEVRISSALRELEEHGYLERSRVRLATGQVVTRTVSYNHPRTAPAAGPEGPPVPVAGPVGPPMPGPRPPLRRNANPTPEPGSPASAGPAASPVSGPGRGPAPGPAPGPGPASGPGPGPSTSAALTPSAWAAPEAEPESESGPASEPGPAPGPSTSAALPPSAWAAPEAEPEPEPGPASEPGPAPGPLTSAALPPSAWAAPEVEPEPGPAPGPGPRLGPWPAPSPAPSAGPALAAGPAASPGPGPGPGSSAPEAAPGVRVRQDAVDLLVRLREHDPRLLLPERDVARLAAVVSAWLGRGAEPEALRQVLAADLPADLRHPAGLIAYRLREQLPPHLPPPAAAPPVRRPDPWQNCDGCERAFRAPVPGRCRDCPPGPGESAG